MLSDTWPRIFVFGSNLDGRHGKGAALYARKYFGAVYGISIGFTGSAYAIPTKDRKLKPLPLDVIAWYCGRFVEDAKEFSSKEFQLTKIGCGLAGYKEEQIIPMFVGCPYNVFMASGWRGRIIELEARK